MIAYPVQDKFLALQVTELDFEIRPENEKDLYVPLDSVRPKDCFGDITFSLKIDPETKQLATLSDAYIKIIFSGHRGCGKSTELHRFQAEIDDPNRYCSIFIDMEKEVEITTFEPEDLFITLIAKLIERLKKEAVNIDTPQLGDLLKEWLSDTEILKELKNAYQLDLSSEVEAGAGFLGFLKLRSSLKALFSSSSSTMKKIRETVRKNPHSLVDRLNLALDDARQGLTEAGRGKDILFVIDGFEKMKYEIFERLFILDSSLLQALNSNILFTVPINSFYNISSSASADFFQTHILPMIPVSDTSRPLLAQVITRRLDEQRFFDADVLGFCVEQSGGCPRQLLRIVNKAIVRSRGERITDAIAREVCHQLGQEMWDKLDSAHRELLRNKSYASADRKALDLLFSLAVLKYNGSREVNPLLLEFVDNTPARAYA